VQQVQCGIPINVTKGQSACQEKNFLKFSLNILDLMTNLCLSGIHGLVVDFFKQRSGISNLINNRVFLKVVPSPTHFWFLFNFVASFLLLSIRSNFFLSNNKIHYEIVELCYDLHLMQLCWQSSFGCLSQDLHWESHLGPKSF